MSIADLSGWIASLLMLCTFLCQEALMLRTVAIAANVAFISYGALSGLAPVLVLHLLLIAVNIRRLAQTIAQSRISALPSERPRLFGLTVPGRVTSGMRGWNRLAALRTCHWRFDFRRNNAQAGAQRAPRVPRSTQA
jgi:hypothetical protein